MSLWLCLRFDLLPLQALNRSEEQAVVVLEKQRVLRANDCACAMGIKTGQSTATVRALAAEQPLTLLERDTAREQLCMTQLCSWAYSISPTLHHWRGDSLLLEIGSCLTLYRGLDRLMEDVRHGLATRGYQAEQGLATTPRAAWLLSHVAPDIALAVEQPLEQRLGTLPIALLKDHAATIDSLRRAGIHHFEDLLKLPPPALAKRCGKAFVDELQQLLGLRTDLRKDYQPPARFSDTYWFGYEVRGHNEMQPAIQFLLQSLCRFLRNTQLQTGEIQWEFITIDGQVQRLLVRSSSHSHDWQNWHQLTGIQLEREPFTCGIEGVTLNCRQLESANAATVDLFNSGQQREPLSSLLDRLRSRLGLQAIMTIGCRDEHLPEHAVQTGQDCAVRSTGGNQQGSPNTQGAAPCHQRPFWLMPQPQPLQLQLQQGALYWNGPLALIYGPERIEDNWWAEPVSRDYYIAQGEQGQHLWVYRDRRLQHWYIQGIFA